MLLLGRREGNPPPERVFGPAGGSQTTVKLVACARPFAAR